MYQHKSLEDTIAAISTAAGQGGIGIVRLSGSSALSIADQMFLGKDNKKPSQFKTFTIHYGAVVRQQKDNMEVIDEALVSVMRTPHSYTKEDVVEFSCHGGVVALKAILTRTTELGARLAEPGEFTKRAFLNGRIDLTQAEAVLDIIQSKTETFLKVSNNQLKGELSTELESIRVSLLEIYTEIEAMINFPEDDINASSLKQVSSKITSAKDRVVRLLTSSEHGKILKEGVKVVLCGKANVGKSSLLNALLKQPRAIVTDIAGTTRDTIEETAQIRGIPFQLVDTAGILEPRDLIEEEAIKRSQMYMKRADLVLLILDASRKLSQKDHDVIKHIQGNHILVVMNKTDLKQVVQDKDIQKVFPDAKMIKVSALNREGIDVLEQTIVEDIWEGRVVDTHGIMVSNIRHIHSLRNCQTALEKGIQILSDGVSVEFVSEEIKSAVNCLDNITGRNIDDDLLDKIFSEFCIGK